MNNKEFIPYEQASELIELGFTFYDSWLDMKCYAQAWDFSLSFKKNLPIPLYHQAFRWFREKHGHNGVIEGSKRFGFEWCIYRDEFEYIKPPNNSDTYEEAELVCIKKLIEIVKNQNT